jgi:5-methylthioadenosine/S-adenosylhomocysteine deaminase
MSQTYTARLTWTGFGFAEGLAVSIADGAFGWVGPVGDAPGQVEDLGEVALFPGTVNAHGHAFQNLLKGWADDRTFASWRDDVLYPASEKLDTHDIYTGALFAFAEALRAGITTTVDFFYLHDDGNENARAVIRAAQDAGIRLVLARTFYDLDAPTKAPRRYRENAADAAERTRQLASEFAGVDGVSIHPAPHSLHAATPETIAAALDVARELGVACHLHLAEASYEVEQVTQKYGTTPVRLLQREGLLVPELVTIHSVWVDDEEIDMLAEAGTAVVHCPGANAFLGDGMARVPEMLAKGVIVGLGPDGGCANNRQSVFEEMRMACLIAKARLTDGSVLTADTALVMGTRVGAELLRSRAGRIQEGSPADLVVLDLTDLSLQPPGHLGKHIVNSMTERAISRVMVGGRWTVVEGTPVEIDMPKLLADVATTSEKLRTA